MMHNDCIDERIDQIVNWTFPEINYVRPLSSLHFVSTNEIYLKVFEHGVSCICLINSVDGDWMTLSSNFYISSFHICSTLCKRLIFNIFPTTVWPVSEKLVPEKSLGTSIGKIWYRKKVSEPVPELIFVAKILEFRRCKTEKWSQKQGKLHLNKPEPDNIIRRPNKGMQLDPCVKASHDSRCRASRAWTSQVWGPAKLRRQRRQENQA